MSAGDADSVTIADYAGLVGREVGVSGWMTVDQARIDRFADTVGDHQFIHVDPARARAESPFGGTIAHGFLTLSLLSAMVAEACPRFAEPTVSINYGLDRVRFLAPVPAGAPVRGRFTLAEMTERRPGAFLLRHSVVVEIADAERPALVADWLTMAVPREETGKRAMAPGSPAPRPTPLTRGAFARLLPMTVRLRDCDIYGHMNNAVYNEYFDTAVNQVLIEAGVLDMAAGPVIGLVVEMQASYFAEVSFPGAVTVGVSVARVGRSSVSYRFALFRDGEDTAAAQGGYTHVFIDRENRRPVDLPAGLRAAVEGLRDQQERS